MRAAFRNIREPQRIYDPLRHRRKWRNYTGIEVISSILYMKRVTAFCPSRELFLLPGIGTTGNASPLERTTLVGPWEAEYDPRSYVVLGQKGLSIQVLLCR